MRRVNFSHIVHKNTAIICQKKKKKKKENFCSAKAPLFFFENKYSQRSTVPQPVSITRKLNFERRYGCKLSEYQTKLSEDQKKLSEDQKKLSEDQKP